MLYAVPIQTQFEVKITHEYITNCVVLSNVNSYLLVLSIAYTLIIAVWIVGIFFLFDEN